MLWRHNNLKGMRETNRIKIASTTTNKKEIVNFLWEWTESHTDWNKLLSNRIVSTKSNFQTINRQSKGLQKFLGKFAL